MTNVTVIGNDKNELVPTRVQSRWRVFVDYRKLNAAIREDLFSLSFLDQMCSIYFIGPFPSSFGNEYILLVVDYVSRWVEVIPCRTYDAKVAVKFLRENIFAQFSIP